MMAPDDPIFRDEAAALSYVTTLRWPRGPYCPFCLQTEALSSTDPATSIPRYACPCCKNAFSVTTGTLLGRDSVPLTKWLMTLQTLSPPRLRSLHAMLQATLGPGDINPELRLVADGRALRANAVDHLTFRFDLPPRISVLTLCSRHVVPAEQSANSPDIRRLGVSLHAIELEAGDTRRTWDHDDPALVDGFHPAEASHRWTTGYAILPMDAYPETPCVVRVKLANLSLRYPTG